MAAGCDADYAGRGKCLVIIDTVLRNCCMVVGHLFTKEVLVFEGLKKCRAVDLR